jgi:hypothetical protein
MSYKDLVGAIETGVMKIPAFQRDFDWDLERTLRLLDSIAKRYPVGAFLLWDTDELFGAVRQIGDMDLPEVPHGKDVCYVLDGQQRITSLYAAASGATVKRERYVVFADLDADPLRQEVFTTQCDDKRRFVALHDIIGEYPNVSATKLSRTRQTRFQQIREAFRECRFPVVRVRNQTVDAVCEMFERVNTGGLKLDAFDIMVAKTWTPDFNLREKWDEVDRQFTATGFAFQPRIVLQALAAHKCDRVSEQDFMRIGREEIIDAWGRVCACLELACDFLSTRVRLPGTRLLSYPAVLVILARFFDLTDLVNPNATQAGRLAQYYWRVGLDTRYYADAGSRMEMDLRLMRAIHDGGKGEVPMEDGKVLADHVLDAPLRPSWAFSAALLALLAHERPRDLQSGSEIVLDNSNLARANSRHYHHVFPKKWLLGQGWSDADANSVANVMLVPAQTNLRIQAAPPSKYMTRFARQAGDEWGAWLRSHLEPILKPRDGRRSGSRRNGRAPSSSEPSSPSG